MAPRPPVAKVIQLRLVGQMTTGVPWGVTDYYKYSGSAPNVTDIEQWCQVVCSNVGLWLTKHWQGDTTFSEAIATDLTSPTSAAGSFAQTHTGTLSGNELADSICVVESKHGSLKYRGGHSRTYWPALGGTGANADGRSWNPTSLAAFQGDLGSYLSGIINNADQQPWGPIQRSIVHYTGQHPGITYPFVENVASSTLDNLFGSQRRRLGR